MKLFLYILIIILNTICLASSDISLNSLRASVKKQMMNSTLSNYFEASDVKVYFMEGASSLEINPQDVSAVYVISQKSTGFENLSSSIKYYNHIGMQFKVDGSAPQIRFLALDENNNIYVASTNFIISYDTKVTCNEIREFFSSEELKECYSFGIAIIKVLPTRLLEISKLDWLEDISADKETYRYPFVFGPSVDVTSASSFDVDQFRTFTNELRKEGNITPLSTNIQIP
jgi:hypothetical protein